MLRMILAQLTPLSRISKRHGSATFVASPARRSRRGRVMPTTKELPLRLGAEHAFADVAEEMASTSTSSFNDLARAPRVDALVTRSIGGHLTEQMQRPYYTLSGAEQRESIAKV